MLSDKEKFQYDCNSHVQTYFSYLERESKLRCPQTIQEFHSYWIKNKFHLIADVRYLASNIDWKLYSKSEWIEAAYLGYEKVKEIELGRTL